MRTRRADGHVVTAATGVGRQAERLGRERDDAVELHRGADEQRQLLRTPGHTASAETHREIHTG